MLRRRHSSARRLRFVFLVSLAATGAAVRAAELIPLVVPLTVNEIGRGDVPIAINANGDDVLMRISDLEAAGAAGARWERQKLIAAVATSHTAVPLEGGETIWLNALRPLVDYRFDSSELTLRVTFDPRLLAATELNAVDTLRPKGIVYSADSSTFFNYALNSTALKTPSVFGEIGHSFRGNLLYSSFSRAPDGTFTRGLTNFVMDQRLKMRRLTLGDAPVTTTDPLGGGALIGGATWSRNFALDPYFIRQPSIALRGFALSPSTVDVYVNGMLVAQRTIPPGEFELRDVPLATGAGNVRMVVRDAFGGERVTNSTYYAASNVLAQGLSEYTYSIGKVRDQLSTSGGYGDPAAVASHRLGITDYFTAGGRIEASRRLWSAGPNAALRTRFGDFGTSLAASHDDGRSGYAYAFDYRYLARVLSYGFTVQKLSREYANLSIKAADDRSLLTSTAYVAFGLPYASAAVQWSTSQPRDTSRRNEISLITSFPIANRVSAYASGGFVTQDGKRRRQFTTGVSVYAGRNTTASATVSSFGTGNESALELQRPIPVGTGFGYRLRLGRAGGTDSGTGLVQYQSPFGRYEAAFDPYDLGANPSVTIAGGLITERGRVLFTPPVQDSFALVRVPGVEGVRVYSANQLIGRTDSHGDLLLPSLLAYYGNAIRIDDHDVPLDYQVGAVEKVIAPPYRGGALVEFPVSRIQAIGGTIKVEHAGRTVVPAYGELTLSSGERSYVSPVGTGGEFYFENVPAGTYSASISWADGTCTFSVDMPSSNESMVNIGDLTCKGTTP